MSDQMSTAKVLAIKKFLQVSKSAEGGQLVLDHMISTIRKQEPDLPETFIATLKEEINMDELLDLLIPVYDRHFTQGDIEDLISFYDTPIGKKLIATKTSVTMESFKAGETWGRKVNARVRLMLEARGRV